MKWQQLCFSASVEATALLALTLFIWPMGFRGQSAFFFLFFVEMTNISPIDSTEALLSVPRACSLHCCPAFTVELFILVSRASQLTHWGAVCTKRAAHNGSGKERIWDTSAGELRGGNVGEPTPPSPFFFFCFEIGRFTLLQWRRTVFAAINSGVFRWNLSLFVWESSGNDCEIRICGGQSWQHLPTLFF